MCYDETTNSDTVLYKIKERWYADETKTQYWSSNFSSLTYDGDLFYFNTADAIYSIMSNGTNKRVFFNKPEVAAGDIYGIATGTDGNIYLEFQKKPDVPGIVIKIVFPKGDVSLNGFLNISDVTLIQKHLLKKTNLSLRQINLADYNGDGKVNINDATEIQRKLAGL